MKESFTGEETGWPKGKEVPDLTTRIRNKISFHSKKMTNSLLFDITSLRTTVILKLCQRDYK
jgi:hypothetical protein